jgi:hypothetical protein
MATEVNETTDKNRTPKADQVRPMLEYAPDGHYWYLRAPVGMRLRKLGAGWPNHEPRVSICFELITVKDADAQVENEVDE